MLVEPRESGNVGSCARALKNMGFRSLVRVRGASIEAEPARQMAVSARDVLDGSERVESLEEAIAGSVLVAATTRRWRANAQPRPILLKHAVPQLLEVAASRPVSILFGNEKWGLTREDLQQAGLFVLIPTHPDFPSLNLAQAVLLVAYELRMALVQEGAAASPKVAKGKRKIASADMLDMLYQHAETALVASGFFLPHRVENGMSTLRGILSRSRLEEREVRFLMGVFGRLAHPVDRDPEKVEKSLRKLEIIRQSGRKGRLSPD